MTTIQEKPFHISRRDEQPIVDVYGPYIQFLTSLDQHDSELCFVKGVIPPGASIPLHGHAEDERFYIVSGQVEVYVESDWHTAKAGDFLEIPGDIKHGFRNQSSQPALVILQTTVRLGRFFQEIGKPLSFEGDRRQPSPEELAHFVLSAQRYDYWLATPEENAAIGIVLA
jgi:quercetin dioxygenase-like cupin family protein